MQPTQAPAQNGELGAISLAPRHNEQFAYIFTVADRIAPLVKSHNPDWADGGIIRPNMTLQYCGGYVRRCEITVLKQKMESEAKSNFHPMERKHVTASYTITEADPDNPGQVRNRLIGYNPDTETHDGLLRVPYYPGDDIAQLTQVKDGTVVMPISNARQRDQAQKWLHPDWPNTKIPKTIAQLQAHYEERRDAARELPVDSGREFFMKVSQAAIKSCTDYEASTLAFINDLMSVYKQAETKGWAWTFGPEADMAFTQLSIPRPDNLTRENQDRVTKLEEQIGRLVDVFATGFAGGRSPLPAAPEAPAPPAKGMTETGTIANEETTVEICNMLTSTGKPCANKGEEGGFCKQPSHNLIAFAKKVGPTHALVVHKLALADVDTLAEFAHEFPDVAGDAEGEDDES